MASQLHTFKHVNNPTLDIVEKHTVSIELNISLLKTSLCIQRIKTCGGHNISGTPVAESQNNKFYNAGSFSLFSPLHNLNVSCCNSPHLCEQKSQPLKSTTETQSKRRAATVSGGHPRPSDPNLLPLRRWGFDAPLTLLFSCSGPTPPNTSMLLVATETATCPALGPGPCVLVSSACVHRIVSIEKIQTSSRYLAFEAKHWTL